MTSNVAFKGFGDTTFVECKSHCGKKSTLKTEVTNSDYHDFLLFNSLPDKFINKTHPERIKLESFKTKKDQCILLNGQILAVNKENKDVISKVVRLLQHMKKEMPYLHLKCFIEENFLDKMAPKKRVPLTKQILNLTGKIFKRICKVVAGFPT